MVLLFIYNVSAELEGEGKNSTVGVKIGTRIISEKAASRCTSGDILYTRYIVFTRAQQWATSRVRCATEKSVFNVDMVTWVHVKKRGGDVLGKNRKIEEWTGNRYVGLYIMPLVRLQRCTSIAYRTKNAGRFRGGQTLFVVRGGGSGSTPTYKYVYTIYV